MMLFVRGIKGNIKLNPGIKEFGFIVIVLGLLIGSTIHWGWGLRGAIQKCESAGGTWVGGTLKGAYCALAPHQDDT
ncbi:MAG: hypothetical protein KKE77_05600 [Alphaproteobacteria bacterium]|nr:hypothetical protein [Alphaproteobacteria bacterium]